MTQKFSLIFSCYITIRYRISMTFLWWMGAVKSRYKFSSSSCFLSMVTPRFVWNVDNTNIWISTSLKRIYKLFDWKCRAAISQPTFQRWINIVSMCWDNVDPTLKLKQYPTWVFQRCTTLIKHQTPMLKQRWKNVAQRWYNVVSTLFQRSLNVIKTISRPIILLNMDL